MTPEFPHRKDFANGRFAYVVPLTFGRGRICLGSALGLWFVQDSW